MLSMISAMAHNRVIGFKGDMPWHLPADLSHFKTTTMGCPVIMGRKTFDSIGKPLPGRKNIILSRSSQLVIDGCEIVANLDEALSLVTDDSEAFVIGGQQLYELALPSCKRLYLTHIDANLEGDTFFPDYHRYEWTQLSSEAHESDAKNEWSYRFEILEREHH